MSMILPLLFFLLAAGGAGPALAHPQGTLTFGVFPYKSPKSIVEVFAPLATRLQDRLGRKVRLVSAPDAATFLARCEAGEYDLALPNLTYYYVIRNKLYQAIARGEPSFVGGVIVLKESGIHDLHDFRGRRVAAAGEHSYAAYQFFRQLLQKNGLFPPRDLTFHFPGRVDSIVYGVMSKKYDAGVIRLDTLETPAFAHLKERFRVVARSAEVPHFPFMVKKGMEADAVAAIREVLISLARERPEDRAILESLQVERIVAAADADYDSFHQIIKRFEPESP